MVDFDNLVDEYGTDAAARRFATRQPFVAPLFAQFRGGSSPREVESVMPSRQASNEVFALAPRSLMAVRLASSRVPMSVASKRNSDGCAPNPRSADKRGPRAPATGDAAGQRSAPTLRHWQRTPSATTAGCGGAPVHRNSRLMNINKFRLKACLLAC
ncbi:MAG: DUF4372 domain-containing protein [Methylocella sp.]